MKTSDQLYFSLSIYLSTKGTCHFFAARIKIKLYNKRGSTLVHFHFNLVVYLSHGLFLKINKNKIYIHYTCIYKLWFFCCLKLEDLHSLMIFLHVWTLSSSKWIFFFVYFKIGTRINLGLIHLSDLNKLEYGIWFFIETKLGKTLWKLFNSVWLLFTSFIYLFIHLFHSCFIKNYWYCSMARHSGNTHVQKWRTRTLPVSKIINIKTAVFWKGEQNINIIILSRFNILVNFWFPGR